MELLPLEGATVVDVGCGDGALARMLALRGVHVIGVEVSPRQLAAARAFPPVADERFIQGVAEDLPVNNRSADIVVFFNSLHHVDAAGLPKALKEAMRVLRPGGLLFVSEPMAEGPYFELMKPAHDETLARQRTQEALRHAPDAGFLLEKTLTHIDTITFKDFEAFRERITSINPETREHFVEREGDLREAFERLGTRKGEDWCFDQPLRVHLFRRG